MFDIGLKIWQTGQTWATYGMCSMGSIFTQSSDDVEILANDMKVFFPTCQVRVVRFYVSCLVLLLSSPPPPRPPPPRRPRPPRPTATRDPQCSLSDLNHDHPCSVFPAGPQPRPSMLSVPCRTSTTTIHVSVPCRTSTTTIPAQCSLPDLNHDHPRPVFPAGLNHDHPRPVFPAGPQPRPSTPSVPRRTSTASIHAKRYAT